MSRALHPGGASRIAGLILILAGIVLFTAIRYWKVIPWSAR